MSYCGAGGNEYGQCGEEPERKDDVGKPVRRDIMIPQRCVPKLSVRQVNICKFLILCILEFHCNRMGLARQN